MYRRTVLVIWPKQKNFVVRYPGIQGLHWALVDVSAISSASPTAEQMELVEFVLCADMKNGAKVAKAVCRIALQWKDHATWTKAVLACCTTQGMTILPERDVFAAVGLFGFEAVRAA